MATKPTTVPTSTKVTGQSPSDKRQLRRDRITAGVVMAVIAAMIALVVWLASLGNGSPENINDFWHMMP